MWGGPISPRKGTPVLGQHDTTYRLRGDGTVVDCHFPGRSSDTVESTLTLADGLPGPLVDAMLLILADAIRTGESQRSEWVGHLDGASRVLELRALRSGLDEGLVVLRDTTEQRSMEHRLAMAERMASLGRLAAGVAHEINNPLAYVIGSHTVAERELAAAIDELTTLDAHAAKAALAAIERATAALRDAAEGAARVEHAVRDLKTFSRADEDRREPVDLLGVVRSSSSLAQNAMRHRARVITSLPPIPMVLANGPRLGQVVLNLLLNAAESIAEGSAETNAITISLREEGNWVVLSVRDTGVGIAEDELPHVFDPFYTTKPVGQGTGLGLAICHGIVSSFGGEIRASSRQGEGSVFEVRLPALARNETGERRDAPDAGVARRARILIVDDEPLIGKVLQRLLSPHHDVTVVLSGKAALSAISEGAPFDVVLCDLMMPELTGMGLHAELARTDPATARKMVFMTGGTFTQAASEFLAREAPPQIAKPFELAAIEAAVKQTLDLL